MVSVIILIILQFFQFFDVMNKKSQFELATKILSIAQIGRAYCQNEFCLERYEKLEKIASEIFSHLSSENQPANEIFNLLVREVGYPTPKLDVRGAIFKNNQILLVQEKQDEHWSLPGGWADLHDSPSEAIIREVYEETGLKVKTIKLIGLFDKLKHDHPLQLPHAYKCFFLCKPMSDNFDSEVINKSIEIKDVRYFDLEKLPPLSTDRVTRAQINLCFAHYQNPNLPSAYD